MIKRLKIDNIEDLFDLITRDYKVYSPQEKNGVLALLPANKFNKSSLSLFQSIMPAKSIFLDDVTNLQVDPAKEKIAIFGLHLCDVSALTSLDQLFAQDPFYRAKRDGSLLVATNCQPTSECFCHLFEANKHTGYDLFIQEEKDNSYSVFAKTEKGVNYLDKIKGKSVVAKPKEVGHQTVKTDLGSLTEAINQRDKFEAEWQGIANNCFGCGACTAVCPLCFCFDVVDRTNPKDSKSHRSRVSDSCFFSNFSKISSYDYRSQNVDRLYNWYHHKFVRQPKQNGTYLCVGCGRCITACPANLNIIKILGTMDKLFLKESQNDT